MMSWPKASPTILTVALLALILTSGVTFAADLVIDAEQQLKYANDLLESRHFRRAGEEFQRFTFFFPNHPEQRGAMLDGCRSFLQAKDVQSAQALLKKLLADGRLDPVAVEGHFLLAESHLRLGAVTHAVVRLNNLITLSDDPAIEDRAYHRIGWIQLEATDWQGALRAFDRISPAGKNRYNTQALMESLKTSDQIAQKNPALAGTLSIIPGAGQLYCRRYKDAAVAFILNVGTFWAAHDAFDNDQNALGGLLSIIGLGFYAGNIYGAVNDAHKFNAYQKSQYRDHLRQNYSLRSETPDLGSFQGAYLGLRFSF